MTWQRAEDVSGSFLTHLLQYSMGTDVLHDERAFAVDSSLALLQHLPVSHAAFETCFGLTTKLNLMLLGTSEDTFKLFVSRHTQCIELITPKGSQRIKCMLLYLELTRQHMAAIQEGVVTTYSHLKVMYEFCLHAFTFLSFEKIPELRMPLHDTLMQCVVLTSQNERFDREQLHTSLQHLQQLCTSMKSLSSIGAHRALLSLVARLPLVQNQGQNQGEQQPAVIVTATQLILKLFNKFPPNGQMLLKVVNVLCRLESHDALAPSIGLVLAKSEFLAEQQWEECCRMHLAAIVVNPRKLQTRALALLVGSTRANADFLSPKISKETHLRWTNHLVSTLIKVCNASADADFLSCFENTRTFIIDACKNDIFTKNFGLLLSFWEELSPSLVRLHKTNPELHPLMMPAIFLLDQVPHRLEDKKEQRERAVFVANALIRYAEMAARIEDPIKTSVKTSEAGALLAQTVYRLLNKSEIFLDHDDIIQMLSKKLLSLKH